MSFLRGSVLVKGQFVVQMDIATYSHTALKFPALPWSPAVFLRLVLVYLYFRSLERKLQSQSKISSLF